jgi:hypothetical protein
MRMYLMLFFHSSLALHFGCFYFLAISNSAPRSMGVQLSLEHNDFISLDMYTAIGFLDHMVVLFLIF